MFLGRCFCRKKNPGGHAAGLAPGVWGHPITWFGGIQSPSVAQWSSTRLGPKIEPIFRILTLFHNFPKTQFAPKMTISMIWSCRSVLPSQNVDAHLFHGQKKTMIFMIFNDLNNLMVLAPRPLGPMGPLFVRYLLEKYFMVCDQSRSVRMVFRSPGNPLIKLFHFLFN